MTGTAAAKRPSATEATPLQPTCVASTGAASILCGLCIAYMLAIIPVGISSSLLPALEGDSTIGWTPTTSGVYLFMSTWAVALGALTIGWLPDYFPNAVVMLFFILAGGFMLEMMSLATTAFAFMAMHMAVFFLKALTWPAAMSVVGTHLKDVRPEMGILMVGLASRFASSCSGLLMGSLLLHMNWRSALQWIGIMLICAVVVFRLLIRVGNAEHLLTKPAPQEEASSGSGDAEQAGTTERAAPSQTRIQSAADVVAYLQGLLQDRFFLMLICFAVGLELSLGLSLFVSAFMHSIFRTSIADSAIYSGTINFGEVLSIVVGLVAITFGVSRKTLFNIVLVQLCLGIGVSAALCFVKVSFERFFTLGMLLGFSTTLGGYIVAPLYCIELAKIRNTWDIAARVTIVDGVSAVVGASVRLFLGMKRNTDEETGLKYSAAFCTVGTITMATCLFLLQRQPLEASGQQHVD